MMTAPVRRLRMMRSARTFVTSVLFVCSAWAVRPATASPGLFLSSDPAAGAGAGLWSMQASIVSPLARTSTVSITVALLNHYQIFVPGTTQTGDSSSLPTSFGQQGWRSDTTLTGNLPAGTVTLNLKANSTGIAGLFVQLEARLWKSSDAGGAGATAVTGWTAGTGGLNLVQLTPVNDTVSFTVPSTNFNNEYLFLEVGVQYSVAAALTGIQLICNETGTAGTQLAMPTLATYTPTPNATQTYIATLSVTPTQTPNLTQTYVATLSATATPRPSSGPAPKNGEIRLSHNRFDPSKGDLIIRGQLDVPGKVTLELYDLAGHRRRGLLNSDLPAGAWVVRWDGKDDGSSDMASDIYLLVLRQDGVSRTQKTALVRN